MTISWKLPHTILLFVAFSLAVTLKEHCKVGVKLIKFHMILLFFYAGQGRSDEVTNSENTRSEGELTLSNGSFTECLWFFKMVNYVKCE